METRRMQERSQRLGRLAWVCVGALVLAGCSSGADPSPQSNRDAGADAGIDAGTQPYDAGSDAGTDGGTDAGTDGGTGGIPFTANSIQVTTGPGRSDPEGVGPATSAVTRLTWRDARGAARTLTLGAYLYQYDFSFVGGTPTPGEVTTRSVNDDAWGHPGFGYVVSHNDQNGNSPLGKVNPTTALTTTVFQGGHHALYRVELVYDRDREGGGHGIEIPVVIDWMVATGRDHPVWAVTWKLPQAKNPEAVSFDSFRMDVRGPYGSLNFDGAASRELGDAIGGVAWGDSGYRFTTTLAPLTMNSSWTYDTPSDVAFSEAWTQNVNAALGIVQTRPGDGEMGYPDRVLGRERGHTSADAFTGKGDCSGFGDARVYAMPCVNGWPYQLMNYDWSGAKSLDEATGTKLVAWGTPYGWLGASSFDGFDGPADGRGDRAYSTFIVLGPKCRYSGAGCDQPGAVDETLQEVDALAAAHLDTVTAGALVTEVPRGPGATDTKTLASGYDDTYATFDLSAEDDRVAFTFTPAAGQPVERPIFQIHGYTHAGLPAIKVAGTAVTVNGGDASSGAFVSLDAENQTLWVTLNQTLSEPTQVEVGPG